MIEFSRILCNDNYLIITNGRIVCSIFKTNVPERVQKLHRIHDPAKSSHRDPLTPLTSTPLFQRCYLSPKERKRERISRIRVNPFTCTRITPALQKLRLSRALLITTSDRTNLKRRTKEGKNLEERSLSLNVKKRKKKHQ